MTLDFEAAKQMAASPDAAVRLELAGRADTRPELLYYMAEDDDPRVRRAVAANEATPVHAAEVLAVDPDLDVREVLARRLVKLLPDLSKSEQSKLYQIAVKALQTLAHDQIVQIRMALANTLKDKAYAPAGVAKRLADDVEQVVAEPILRFCAVLNDRDLLEIIARHPPAWALSAIAGRETVSGSVSSAIVGTRDLPANGILIQNKGAEISEDTWTEIMDLAKSAPELQNALQRRKSLPTNLRKRLMDFVEGTVAHALEDRGRFDRDTAEEIANTVQRRLDYAEHAVEERGAERAKKLFKSGELDDETIGDALSWKDREFVVAALGLLAHVSPSVVDRVMESSSPKAVTALTWRAGLGMRLAMQLQQQLAHIAPRQVLNARGGFDYPLTDEEMIWQLEFFDVKGTPARR